MNTPLLNESTLKEICDELSKRNLNFVFMSQSYGGPEDDHMPFIAFGIKQEYLIEMTGILEITKTQLISEFKHTNNMYMEDEEPTDDNETV